jgi:MFS family permease
MRAHPTRTGLDGQSAVTRMSPRQLEEPLGRNAALTLLSLAVLLSMTTWFSASAVLPQLREQWNLTAGTSSLMTISVQVGFVIGSLASALLNLADVVRPRRLFLLGSLGAALVNLALVLSPAVSVALGLRLLTGVCLALVYPTGLKAISMWFRRGRGMALGVMVGALTLGSALPHLIDGFTVVNWRIVILVTSLLTILGGLIAEFGVADGPLRFPSATFDPRQAPLAFSNRGVRLACLGYFGHMWELYAMWAWFAIFFADVLTARGFAEPRRGAAFATFAVIGIGALGCLVGGILGDRWGRTRTTSLAMAISGSCALLIGLTTLLPVPFVLAVGLLWGFAIIADSAQFSAIVTEVADQRYVGTAVTLQLAIGFSLTVLTIFLIPILRDHLSWVLAFALLAPGPFFGLLAMLRLKSTRYAKMIAGGIG